MNSRPNSGLSRRWRFAASGLLLLLAACGGGGGDSPATVPASISVQPASVSTANGSGATFSVTASGDGLSFQWQRSVDGGLTWLLIVGATASSYSIAVVDAALNGYQYRVAITGASGSVATSTPVTLSVKAGTLQSRKSGAVYYQAQLNLSIVANANLPATMPLGVPNISADGTMPWSAAKAWINALNAAKYLGFSDWRLPKVTPLNGSAFQYNNLATDPQGYAGRIDLGYNISAPGTQYAGSTVSELAFLFFNVFGNVAKLSSTGVAQNQSANTSAPLANVRPGDYWTSVAYGNGGAMAFDLLVGTQYAFVAEDWRFSVMAVRTGDVGP